jgi:hypothetical protein
VQQELALVANLLVGYDDNVTAGVGGGAIVAPTAMASGGTGFLDGTLNYSVGNTRHALRLDSTGSLSAYPGYLDDPAPGAAVNVSATTTLGHDTRLRFAQRVGYEPLFNVYSQGASSAPLPPEISGATPATGLFERRSWSTSTSAGIEQRWGRRDWTSLSYAYRRQEYTDDGYGDNQAHEVQADHRHGISRTARALVLYRYRNLEYGDADTLVRPSLEHRLEAGPEFQRALSRRSQLRLSFTAGAARLESVTSTTREPYQAWVPTGNAKLSLGLSSDWNIEGGYGRDITTFQGVTDEVYAADTAFLGVGGPFGSRTILRVGTSYGNWKTPVESGVAETMDVYGASLQLRVALTDSLGATAAYYYYYHRYSDPGSLPEGFPAQYDRHAIRVGLTLWVPFVGASTPPRLSAR